MPLPCVNTTRQFGKLVWQELRYSLPNERKTLEKTPSGASFRMKIISTRASAKMQQLPLAEVSIHVKEASSSNVSGY